MRSGFANAVLVSMALAGVGCGGSIVGDGTGSTPAGGTPEGNAPRGADGKPTATMPNGAAVVPIPGGTSTPADPNAAGPMPLRRLTNHEYDNTVRDLLGDMTGPASQFASDRDETFLFRRAGDVAVQDAKLLRTAAETLAAAAVGKLSTILPCDPNAMAEAACLKQFMDGFAMRAYRRPLLQPEIDHLNALFMTGRTTLKLGFADSIGLLIEGILQAPQFLYHWENPAGPAVREGAVVRLSPYELASRLSYFLWGSMPDKDLFAAAAANKLATPADVEAQARRMLMDAKARDAVATFFSDWLALDGLKDAPKSKTAYPNFNDTLVASMLNEVRTFAQSVVFDGDGRWATLMGASYSYVNQALAGVYGMPGVTGTTLQKTNLDASQRAGFLTQSGFLALTGSADGSNPPRRGKAIVTKMLCRDIPPPPANVPPPKPASAGGTTRARFLEHDTNDCAKGCHTLIDPIGFAFENYDGIGKFRTMDNNLPVDASGTIALDNANKTFNNAVELTRALAASAEVRGCFAMQWSRFALARDPSAADQASLQTAAGAFGSPDAAVRDLLVAVATSRSFRYRAPASGEVLP